MDYLTSPGRVQGRSRTGLDEQMLQELTMRVVKQLSTLKSDEDEEKELMQREYFEHKTTAGHRQWFFRLPGISFFALFYYSTPSFEDMESALAVFGTVGALVLSLLISLLSMGYGDYQLVNARFSSPLVPGPGGFNVTNLYAEFWTGKSMGRHAPAISDFFLVNVAVWLNLPKQHSSALTHMRQVAISAVASSVLLTLIIYLHLVFGQKTAHNMNVRKFERERAWWKYTKYVLVAMILLLILGLVEFFVSFWTYVLMRFPDQSMEAFPLLPNSPAGLVSTPAVYVGAYKFTFYVQMALAGIVTFFMGLMGVAQMSMMSLEGKPEAQTASARAWAERNAHPAVEDVPLHMDSLIPWEDDDRPKLPYLVLVLLRALISWLVARMADAMEELELEMPPWRTEDALYAKFQLGAATGPATPPPSPLYSRLVAGGG